MSDLYSFDKLAFMRKYPRRTLPGGIGSTIAIAAAGCLSLTDDADESPADDTDDTDDADDADDTDDEFDVLLEYVPDSVGDNVVLSRTVGRLETSERQPATGRALARPRLAARQRRSGSVRSIRSLSTGRVFRSVV